MPTTLTDIQWDDDVFTSYLNEQSVVNTAFSTSNVVIENDLLRERADGPSNVTSIPSWSPLDSSSEPNISNDDLSDLATAGKITSKKQVGITSYLNAGFSSGDLTAEINGADPMQAIAARVNDYWSEVFQKRLVAALNGILADNDLNDSDDMIYSIATDSADAIDAAERISPEAVIEAMGTMGDRINDVGVIAVHSTVYKTMLKSNVIEFVRPSDNAVRQPTYLGLGVIIDDGLPVTSGSNRDTYVSVLFGPGAIGFGEGSPKIPNEIQRVPDGGNGAGGEALWSRKTWLIHPAGFSFTGSPSGQSPTLAELAAAASWDRIYSRKNVPLCFLRSNG